MFKKLFAFLLLLLALGAGLTLYLPAYRPAGSASGTAVELVDSSFKTPMPLDSFLVCGNNAADRWGVQTGMFTDLALARQSFGTSCVNVEAKVFKVMDRMEQPWYLVALGPFATQEVVDSALVALRQSCQMQGLQVRWPFPKKS